jgi:CheY-like chemotaxis protein
MATILYAEDNQRIQKLFTIAFRGTGHEVVTADNGAQALDLVRARRPDLIVTDLAMPEVDGIKLLQAVKADPALAGIPVVLISASTERARLEQALALGAVAFILKPFSPAELRDRLEAVLTA